MKLPHATLITLCLLAIALAAPLLPYFVIFHSGLSPNPETWAAFGTYATGVVTPLTVVAAVLALLQSDIGRKDEVARILAQGQQADLLHFIEKIEKDIDTALEGVRVNVRVGNDVYPHPGRDVLFKYSMLEWEKLVPTVTEILARVQSSPNGLDRYDEQILMYEMSGMVAAYIGRLREHCEAYDRSAGNSFTSVYFARKYRIATERLNSKGYGVAVWNP